MSSGHISLWIRVGSTRPFFFFLFSCFLFWVTKLHTTLKDVMVFKRIKTWSFIASATSLWVSYTDTIKHPHDLIMLYVHNPFFFFLFCPFSFSSIWGRDKQTPGYSSCVNSHMPMNESQSYDRRIRPFITWGNFCLLPKWLSFELDSDASCDIDRSQTI